MSFVYSKDVAKIITNILLTKQYLKSELINQSYNISFDETITN